MSTNTRSVTVTDAVTKITDANTKREEFILTPGDGPILWGLGTVTPVHRLAAGVTLRRAGNSAVWGALYVKAETPGASVAISLEETFAR